MPDMPDDIELEEQLRHIAARVDRVPGRVLEAAVNSYTWRTVESDLAELVFDSLADNVAPVRGPEQARQLSYEATGLAIDVEVTGSGPERTIMGRLEPPQPASVEIRRGPDVTALDADEQGRFSGTLRVGPFSLRCSTRADPDRPVVTDWITL